MAVSQIYFLHKAQAPAFQKRRNAQPELFGKKITIRILFSAFMITFLWLVTRLIVRYGFRIFFSLFNGSVPDQLIRTKPAQEHVHCIFNEGANHKYRVVFCVENHVRPTSQRTRFQRTKKRCSYSFVSFVSRCRAFVCNSCFRQELRRTFLFCYELILDHCQSAINSIHMKGFHHRKKRKMFLALNWNFTYSMILTRATGFNVSVSSYTQL